MLQCFANCLVNHASSERLLKYLWFSLCQCDIPLNIEHYNYLLKIYVQSDYDYLPIDISEMKKKDIVPNEVTYKYFIEYYCRRGDISNAIRIFNDFLEKQYNPCKDIYYAFILGYLQVNDIENAVETLYQMSENMTVPWSDKFKALMCIYAKLGDLEQLTRILHDCGSIKLKFVSTDIYDVLYTLAVNEYDTHFLQILRKFTVVFKDISYCDEMHFFSKLINIKQESLALQTLLAHLTTYSQFKNHMTSLFLHKIMSSNMKLSKIVDVCQTLQDQCGFENYFLDAIKYSFEQDNEILTLELLKKYSKSGVTKPHYFWPILQKRCKKYDLIGILDIIVYMKHQCKTMPCFDTLKHYVIPYVIGDVQLTVNMLRLHQIPLCVIYNAIAWYWLYLGRMRLTLAFIKTHEGTYWSSLLRDALKNGLRDTGDIESYLGIIDYLRIHDTDTKDDNSPEDILSQHLMYFISDQLPTDKILINNIMNYLKAKCINVSPVVHTAVREYYQTIL